MNTGSCGLHVLHGCFGTAVKKTNCYLEASLNSFYNNIKGTPGRRVDYLELNGLNEMHNQKCSCFFSMKYCDHRWLENIPIIDWVIKVLPKLKVYSNKI